MISCFVNCYFKSTELQTKQMIQLNNRLFVHYLNGPTNCKVNYHSTYGLWLSGIQIPTVIEFLKCRLETLKAVVKCENGLVQVKAVLRHYQVLIVTFRVWINYSTTTFHLKLCLVLNNVFLKNTVTICVRFANGPVFKWHLNTILNSLVFQWLGWVITIIMLWYCHSYILPFENWTLKSPVFRWI